MEDYRNRAIDVSGQAAAQHAACLRKHGEPFAGPQREPVRFFGEIGQVGFPRDAAVERHVRPVVEASSIKLVHVAHAHDIVTEFAEQVAEILGDVLVEQEPHR